MSIFYAEPYSINLPNPQLFGRPLWAYDHPLISWHRLRSNLFGQTTALLIHLGRQSPEPLTREDLDVLFRRYRLQADVRQIIRYEAKNRNTLDLIVWYDEWEHNIFAEYILFWKQIVSAHRYNGGH